MVGAVPAEALNAKASREKARVDLSVVSFMREFQLRLICVMNQVLNKSAQQVMLGARLGRLLLD